MGVRDAVEFRERIFRQVEVGRRENMTAKTLALFVEVLAQLDAIGQAQK
ncbi:hypothetical protein [Burkholderia sp. YIM B11467]